MCHSGTKPADGIHYNITTYTTCTLYVFNFELVNDLIQSNKDGVFHGELAASNRLAHIQGF